MLRFVLRRLLQVIFTLLLLSLLAFGWLRSLPGGPATQLDAGRPVPVQYAGFVSRLVVGDFGTSLSTGRPVLAEIAYALPATAGLMLAALVIAVGLGVPLGYLAARHRGRPFDIATIAATLLGVATPTFVLGYLLLPGFTSRPPWLPAVVLPAVALAAVPLAVIVRSTRGSALDLLGSNVARTANGAARTPGRYVLRTALQPFCTGVGLPAGLLLSAAVLTEKVFGWGGLGTLLADAITARDHPMLEALLVLGAAGYVVLSLVADLATAFVDPRVRWA